MIAYKIEQLGTNCTYYRTYFASSNKHKINLMYKCNDCVSLWVITKKAKYFIYIF